MLTVGDTQIKMIKLVYLSTSMIRTCWPRLLFGGDYIPFGKGSTLALVKYQQVYASSVLHCTSNLSSYKSGKYNFVY